MTKIAMPKNSNELLSQFQEYFDSLSGIAVPTVVSNGFFVQDLSSEGGKLSEALFERWLISRGIPYISEPNGPKTFPDFHVPLEEEMSILEIKEESVDSASSGKTCVRLMKVSECIRAMARGSFFDVTVLTMHKSTDKGSATFTKLEMDKMFTLLKGGGTWGVGYDSTNSNLTRNGSIPFASEGDFVRELLSKIIPHMKEKKRQIPLRELETVKALYL